MGQVLRRLQEFEETQWGHFQQSRHKSFVSDTFPDLSRLPPEISLMVLSKLNATDLCLAGCVWNDLANVESLWHSLCRHQWKYTSIYKMAGQPNFSFKQVYLLLDEATLTFNADPDLGVKYLLDHGLVEDSSLELAKFLSGARDIDWKMQREYLHRHQTIVEQLINLLNFENQFLPNALRHFLKQTKPPKCRSEYLSFIVDRFAQRYVACNPRLSLTKDSVYILCYSLLLLSVDLGSPHIKNKMSKREFIRNTRQAAGFVDEELAGHLYDNVYLLGHIAPKA